MYKRLALGLLVGCLVGPAAGAGNDERIDGEYESNAPSTHQTNDAKRLNAARAEAFRKKLERRRGVKSSD